MTPRHHSVLVIEDDPAIRDFLVALLGDEGYDVRTACEGSEGLVAMCAARPDVIILDLRMPVMDGWAFRRRQRDLDGFGAIPTIIMSAAERPEPADLGAASFLAKPFSTPDMLAAISAAVGANPS